MPQPEQDRWDLLRQYILFGLGVAVILNETFTSGARPPLLVAGLILVGLVPVDMLLSAWASWRRK